MREYLVSSLQTIDQLWQEYSHNHFGFTIQKQVYEEIKILVNN
ncbi:GUN4 domain-containing protein [Sphaerospermopsis aphanizomenoides BCCUSP55]|nr:GUN4 domain-containing protein [Sphaerospermopsis aphanizomenoides]MBK1986202.1 GUN4 domain-containing protein [Sphaerospermopsis aphanizomenoides BCCUSP55]